MVSRFLALGVLFFAVPATSAQACTVGGVDIGDGLSRVSIASCQHSTPVQYQVLGPEGGVITGGTVNLQERRMALFQVPSVTSGTYRVQAVSAGFLDVFEQQWQVEQSATDTFDIADVPSVPSASLGIKVGRKKKTIDVVIRNSGFVSASSGRACASSVRTRTCKTIALIPALRDVRVAFRVMGKVKVTFSSDTAHINCLVRSSSAVQACGWFGR